MGTLFLSKRDEATYRRYVEENLEAIVRDDLLPPEEASRLVYDSSSRVMSEVFEDPRSGNQLRRARRVVEATVLALMKDPAALWTMASVASHDYYTYTHCVNVGMFMGAAAQHILGVRTRHELNDISLGGLLHDIGKTRVPDAILNKPGKLTEEEFAVVKRHPTDGLSLVLAAPEAGQRDGRRSSATITRASAGAATPPAGRRRRCRWRCAWRPSWTSTTP